MTNKDYLEKIKNSQGLTMKDLRKFIKENEHLSDDMPILCERVTDIHFKSENGRTGWHTYKVEGFGYQMAIEQNKEIQKGELESFKEEFFQSWCITKDENSILIYNHY